MASAAPTTGLPLLYNQLEPISSQVHGNFKVKGIESLPQLGNTHAVPLTVDEFALAQRHYPIIFSIGDEPVPLALMGLNEGVNTFVDENGKPLDQSTYMPAYLRRYPFLLARLRQDSDELSLCVDPTTGAVGDFEEGQALFDGDQPSEATKAVLQFCEQFEEAGQRTALFMAEIKKSGLLMDGEVAIQPEGADQPFVYRGFQMVDEEKLRELRGDELRKINQNGLLPLVYAHLFSLSQIREVFARQVAQGKGPAGVGTRPMPQVAVASRPHVPNCTAMRRCVPQVLRAPGLPPGASFHSAASGCALRASSASPSVRAIRSIACATASKPGPGAVPSESR